MYKHISLKLPEELYKALEERKRKKRRIVLLECLPGVEKDIVETIKQRAKNNIKNKEYVSGKP